MKLILRYVVNAAKNTSTHLIDIRELREVGASNDRRLEVVSVEVKLARA